MIVSKWNKYGVLVTSIGAGLVYFLVMFMLPAPILFPYSNFLIPLAFGLAVFIGVFMSTPRQKTLLDELRNIEGFGVDIAMVFEWLIGEEAKISRIKKLANNLSASSKERVDAIITVANKLFENIKIDPSSYRDARRVMGLYLNSTVEILEKVNTLMKKSMDNNHSEMISKLDRTLEDLDDSFRGLVTKMIERDTMRLDVEMEVMRERLNNDGLTVREKSER